MIPFLLRGVSLLGIDSVMCPADERATVWGRIGDVLDATKLDALTTEVGLDEVAALAPRDHGRSGQGPDRHSAAP